MNRRHPLLRKEPHAIVWFDGSEFDFLSNFHASKIYMSGIFHHSIEDGSIYSYPTVEHAFQAAKATTVEDKTRVRLARSPGEAKRLGKSMEIRDDWEQVKSRVMLLCLRQKFRISHLAARLHGTGERTLVEGNSWHDCVWGQCGCDEHKWKGENRLGQLLMQVRKELRE